MEASAGVRIGVDIGGTFTDVVAQLPDGRVEIRKVSTSPGQPADAVVSALTDLLAALSLSPTAITEIIHGTTVGSNTLLQKSGVPTGLLTTKGFRDVLEIARIRTPTMFDLTWNKPEPLVPRRHRVEVDERIAADGSVIRPLQDAEVERWADFLVTEGVRSVAICFINSYANPDHERRAVEIISRRQPGLMVTASVDVLPEVKEYERTSTTVVNAYLLDSMRRYLSELSERLDGLGIKAPLQVVASSGGTMRMETASEKPVFAVASGPAGGVIGAARLGESANFADAIVFDMGGTTAKAAIVEAGLPSLTTEYEFRDGITSPSRFVKGGGYMLKVPSIDIAEVGAGGGSIAWIDAGGLLQIGPESAGALPGPACYAQGNTRPTVTDANVVLGLLSPDGLAGGTLGIEPELAREAIRTFIGEPLGLSVIEAAQGIRRIANVSMARAIRSVTIERGKDPRGMKLIAFGGGGPVHAVEVAAILNLSTVIVPPASGVFASLGMLTSDVEHSLVRSLTRRLDTADPAVLALAYRELGEQAKSRLVQDGFGETEISINYALDLRYLGQSSEISVPVETAFDVPRLTELFFTAYHETFGYASDDPVELVNVRVTGRGRHPHRLQFDQVRLVSIDGGAETQRDVYFDAEKVTTTRCVPRSAVTDEPLAGPAILEAYDTTVVLPKGASVRSGPCATLVIDVDESLFER